MIKLSIFVPVRRNCPWIEGFINSFRTNTYHPENVELILGIDHKDMTTRFFDPNILTVVLDKRKQRVGINDYINRLAKLCKGELLWCLGDDFKIVTSRYDEVLEPYSKLGDKIYKFQPKNELKGNLYQILTRKYLEVTGRFGLYDGVSWYNTVFAQLPQDRTVTIDQLVIHDRELTGEIPSKDFFHLQPEDGVVFDDTWWGSEECKKQIQIDTQKLLQAIKEGA